MAYTVFSLEDDEGHLGSGLSLTEAFARMMALARCDYAFGRDQGDTIMKLTLLEDVPEEYLENPATQSRFVPLHRSKLQDDYAAREELMLRLLRKGIKGIRIIPDEKYEREETKRRTYRDEGARDIQFD